MNLLQKFKIGLTRTRAQTISRITEIIRRNRFDEDALEEIEETLLEADVGVEVVENLVGALSETVSDNSNRAADNPLELIKSNLVDLLSANNDRKVERFLHKPWVILLVGVNGSGKTTTAGKLAYYFGLQDKKTVIAAADTFRAAAVEQVEEWAKRGGARLVKQKTGADPAAVTFDAYQSAKSRGEDLLIVDTAGRLQAKKNLMDELGKIARVLKKHDPDAPHEILLVIDATTGQNGLSQARGFTLSAGGTGLIVTKLDGTARGGVVFPIFKELGIPVQFIGLGEGLEDLQPFDSRTFVEALLES